MVITREPLAARNIDGIWAGAVNRGSLKFDDFGTLCAHDLEDLLMSRFKKICIFNLLIVMAGWLISFCALANEPVYSDPAQPIVVRPSATVIYVRLPENPSTGYQWAVIKYDPAYLQAPVSHYTPGRRDLIGAPGYRVWQFTFKQAAFKTLHKTAVILEYKRPWEKSAVKTQIVTFTVQSK